MATRFRNYREQMEDATRAYDPYRHDPDSIGFDDSYVGPSERELMGGCNRCGGMDDCYCPSPCSTCKGQGELHHGEDDCPDCDGSGFNY